jgi:hypothetical protein
MKKIHYLIFTVLLQLLLSCNSTKIVSSWRDPEKHIRKGEWNKVLVVALLRKETNRRRAEDEMVKFLNGKGIQSYAYLDDSFDKKDEEALREKIRTDGFDAAITMRLIDIEKEKVYKPEQHFIYPVYYNDFSTYYYRNLPYYNNPGTYSVSKKFIIETVIYSIADGKIIWSGITETLNPKDVEKLTDEIADVIHKKMIEDGFIDK